MAQNFAVTLNKEIPKAAKGTAALAILDLKIHWWE